MYFLFLEVVTYCSRYFLLNLFLVSFCTEVIDTKISDLLKSICLPSEIKEESWKFRECKGTDFIFQERHLNLSWAMSHLELKDIDVKSRLKL